MKNAKRFPWALTIISVLAVSAIVISVLPGTGLIPAAPTATLAPTHTPAPCSPSQVQQEVLDFNKLGREFDDDFEIAQNTDRASLQPNIEELQSVRRDAEAYVVSDCLATLKELQLNYMNAFIETVIALFGTMQNPDATVAVTTTPGTEAIIVVTTTPGVLAPLILPHNLTPADIQAINSGMASGTYYRNLYQAEMWRLLGITPTPTLTATTNPLGPEPPTETATAQPPAATATVY